MPANKATNIILRNVGNPITHAETDKSKYTQYLCAKGQVIFVSPIIEITKKELDLLVEHYAPPKPPIPNSSDGQKYFFVTYEKEGMRVTIPLQELDYIRLITLA